MKADTLTPRTLFQKDVRYVIPIFQRPYVWNQDDHWKPLWNDVRNTDERSPVWRRQDRRTAHPNGRVAS